jgi:hypothetical protein
MKSAISAVSGVRVLKHPNRLRYRLAILTKIATPGGW